MTCDLNTQHMCDSGQCINKSWVCDMEKDCQDGSDELNCTESTAGGQCDNSTHFSCTNLSGSCIPLTWQCDGDKDCEDGEDEEGCDEKQQCHDWQFRCADNQCIFNNWECDGEPDCMDGSDEHDQCDNTTIVKTPVIPQPHFPKVVISN